jgi:hypothetical protein
VKARYALWPVIIFSAVSLASACSSDSGTGTDPDTGGTTGTGDGGSGADTGATTSTGATDSVGGMTSDAGSSAGGAGEAVTGGAAGASGAAGAAGGDLCEGKDITCEDDDNPCTEDVCNPATGECGIARTGTSCDDGKYCNGDDTCNEGECTEHEGDPCNGQTCNEADDVCECVVDEDCPADKPGAWSECTFATTCVETGNRTRAVAKFSCMEGACVQEAAVENEVCPRETDGLSCDDGLRCTGVDKCKAGNCDHSGNPCAGGGVDADGCWETGTQCRSCGVGAACGAKYSCCDNSGTTASCSLGFCGIIIAKIGLDPTP